MAFIWSNKFEYEFRSLRAATSAMRMLGSGSPPLHRFRLGLEFALAGRRDLDDMISQHARMARTLAEQLGLPAGVLEGLGAAYETWDGRGWPGALKGDEIPMAARIAQFAEFAEVAYRVGGVESARDLAARRAGKQFDPEVAGLLRVDAEEILGGLSEVATWDAVIAAEPALAPPLSGERLDAALTAIAGFVDLKSPYMPGTPRRWRCWREKRRASSASPRAIGSPFTAPA